MDSPLFSIVVPTRERFSVLRHTLATLLEQDYSDYEIVVSDNNSTDETKEYVTNLASDKIRYFNTEQRLSMSHNWEFALSKARGQWITFIGDDDGLIPTALSHVAGWIKSHDVLAIRTARSHFTWPNVRSGIDGSLRINPGYCVEVRDSIDWLERCCAGNCEYDCLPGLYQSGFIHRSLIDKARKADGTFFQSAIPDLYSAVAISLVSDRYLYSHSPISIAGSSSFSTGASQFSTNKVEATSMNSPSNQFLSEANIPFHPDFPMSRDGSYPPSTQVMVFECLAQAAAIVPSRFQFTKKQMLEAILYVSGYKKSEIREWSKDFAEFHGLNYTQAFVRGRFRKFLSRVSSALQKKGKNTKNIRVNAAKENIFDINEAVKFHEKIRSDL